MLRQVGALVIVVSLAVAARANDASMHLGTGGLVLRSNRAVSIESERLEITPERITVDYVFRNRTREDVTVLVGFPLPILSSNDRNSVNVPFPDAPDGNLVGFRAWAGDREIAFAVEQRAVLDGRDVTALLGDIGVTPALLHALVSASEPEIAPERLAALARAGLIEPGTDHCTGHLTIAVTLHWQQVFPAGRDVRIRHEYQPVTGSSIGTPPYLAESLCYEYPGDGNDVPRDCSLLRTVEYVLTTARTWRGPIRDFHLVVRGADGLRTCFEGLKQTGPGTWELRRENFVPREEILVGLCSAGVGP